jgi:hypothetical protein
MTYYYTFNINNVLCGVYILVDIHLIDFYVYDKFPLPSCPTHAHQDGPKQYYSAAYLENHVEHTR